MPKAESHIYEFMTSQPHTVEDSFTIVETQKRMKDLGIRHLPVMSSGKVVGIISDRDIKAAGAVAGVDLNKTLVRHICHENPYVVNPSTPLRDVAGEMALHHYGCAIVVQDGELVGIFTTVDACRTITMLLEKT